jgi:hypothetical protein
VGLIQKRCVLSSGGRLHSEPEFLSALNAETVGELGHHKQDRHSDRTYSDCLVGKGFVFWGDENVLQSGSADGCTTLNVLESH